MKGKPGVIPSGSPLVTRQKPVRSVRPDGITALSTGDTGGLHYIGNLL
jgi:hypothetical protein